jgi:hypothetical protein
MSASAATTRFPKMLILVEVKDILNVGMPALRALVTSGELRGVQIGARGYLGQILQSRRSCPAVTRHC